MVKTPEEYLSELSFASPVQNVKITQLSSAEQAFVEKYLGEETLAALNLSGPTIDVPVVDAPKRVVSRPSPDSITPEIVTGSLPKPPAVAEKPVHPLTMKDILKKQEIIQMVSFYVEGQLYLLPVAGIQEVLRHMELVKIPLAPHFVAGAINLRGRVTPLVYLSSLLNNSEVFQYGPDNFVIVCGNDQMQSGLIIDKVSSMHMLPRDKIIWNLEASIGDRGDNLCALADLDDKVCGIVAPDMIIQNLLSL